MNILKLQVDKITKDMFSTTGDIHHLNVRPNPYLFQSEYQGSQNQIDEIRTLLEILNISDSAKSVLQILINSIGTNENIDLENNIEVDRMLYELFYILSKHEEKRSSESIDVYFNEMRLGMCPAGRGFRMYQMLFTLQE